MDTKTSEYQKRLRVRLSLFAYAYEFKADSLISDHEFDRLCLLVDTDIPTDNTAYDLYWKTEFSPHTGQWIHAHPERMLLEHQYNRLKESLNALQLEN